MPDIQFEHIDPWIDGHGDKGLSARQKLRRNFEKIKAWMDSVTSMLSGQFLSKVNDDEAEGVITFKKGSLFGPSGAWGWVKETVEGMAGTGWTWFKNLLADFAELAALSVTGDTNMEGNLTVESNLEVDGDTHLQNTYFGDYEEGQNGGAVVVNQDGTVTLYIDFLEVVKAAYFREITVRELKHVGGEIGLTAAAMVCSKVERVSIGADATTGQDIYVYKCYFETTDGKRSILNDFEVGDQALCQAANLREGTSQNVKTKYYWRLVTAVGDDYITLSDTNCAPNSGIPEAGDNIIQFGYRGTGAAASRRQSAIMMSATAADAPSITYYQGLGSDSRNYWEIAAYIVKEDGYSSADGVMHSNTYGSLFIGDRSAYGVPDEQRRNKKFLEYTPDGGLKVHGDISLSNGQTVEEAIEEAEQKMEEVTGQKFCIWFSETDDPTQDATPYPNENDKAHAANEPASEWDTDTKKEQHLQDLYFDRTKLPGTAGRNWRWVKEEENGVSTYFWENVTDKETLKALELIGEANARLDVLANAIEAAVTLDRLVASGFRLGTNGMLIEGNKLEIAADTILDSVVTEASDEVAFDSSASTIIKTEKNAESTIVPGYFRRDPMRSLVVNALNEPKVYSTGVSGDSHLVCLPFYDENVNLWISQTDIHTYSDGRFSLAAGSGSSYDYTNFISRLIDQWQRGGTLLSITNESDMFINNYEAILDKESSWWNNGIQTSESKEIVSMLMDRVVLVCSDPRLVCYDNVNTADETKQLVKMGYNDGQSYLWQPGRFSCGGYVSRFIALLPGQTLQLRSQILDVATSEIDENTGEYVKREVLTWVVVNASDFVPIDRAVLVDGSLEIGYNPVGIDFANSGGTGLRTEIECVLGNRVLALEDAQTTRMKFNVTVNS